jgi:uncharacterized membrane protein (DUF441 family)
MPDRGYKKGVLWGLLIPFLLLIGGSMLFMNLPAMANFDTGADLSFLQSNSIPFYGSLLIIVAYLGSIGLQYFRGQKHFAIGLIMGTALLLAFFLFITYVGTYIETGHFPGH